MIQVIKLLERQWGCTLAVAAQLGRDDGQTSHWIPVKVIFPAVRFTPEETHGWCFFLGRPLLLLLPRCHAFSWAALPNSNTANKLKKTRNYCWGHLTNALNVQSAFAAVMHQTERRLQMNGTDWMWQDAGWELHFPVLQGSINQRH